MGLIAKDKFNEIRDHIKENRGLYSNYHYMDWEPGDPTITLDGEYSIETLRQIVDWISFVEDKKGGEENGKL